MESEKQEPIWLNNYNTREGGLGNESPLDIKDLGIPNVCFSLTEKDDKREKEFSEQRMERGFDDSETWALDYTIARFILPRLKRYDEIAEDAIIRSDKVKQQTKNVIAALELVIRDGEGESLNGREEKEVEEGMRDFVEIFRELWW